MAIKKLLEPPGHLSEPVSQGPWGSGEMRLGSKICNDRAATRATTPWRPGRHNVQTHVFYKNRVCVWVRVMKYKWVTCILCVRVWMRMNQCVHVVENIYACMNMYMFVCQWDYSIYMYACLCTCKWNVVCASNAMHNHPDIPVWFQEPWYRNQIWSGPILTWLSLKWLHLVRRMNIITRYKGGQACTSADSHTFSCYGDLNRYSITALAPTVYG